LGEAVITIAQLFQPEAAGRSTLDRPLEHLMDCHRRIEDRLATLERVVPILQSQARWSEALEAVEHVRHFLDSNGVLHTADEEVSLFPRLRSKATAQEIAFFDRLEADHDAAEATYAELKAVVQELERRTEAALVGQFTSLVSRLCGLYRRHIEEEDTLLIPIARRLLSEPELAAIAAEMKSRRATDPKFQRSPRHLAQQRPAST
jgi:hemerythrin-like domain-containing protein